MWALLHNKLYKIKGCEILMCHGFLVLSYTHNLFEVDLMQNPIDHETLSISCHRVSWIIHSNFMALSLKSYPQNSICFIPTKLPSLWAQAWVVSEVDSLGIFHQWGILGFNSHGSSSSTVMCPLFLTLWSLNIGVPIFYQVPFEAWSPSMNREIWLLVAD